jgi:hypothetical protein
MLGIVLSRTQRFQIFGVGSVHGLPSRSLLKTDYAHTETSRSGNNPLLESIHIPSTQTRNFSLPPPNQETNFDGIKIDRDIQQQSQTTTPSCLASRNSLIAVPHAAAILRSKWSVPRLHLTGSGFGFYSGGKPIMLFNLLEFTLSVTLSAPVAPREDIRRVLVYSSECTLSYRHKIH